MNNINASANGCPDHLSIHEIEHKFPSKRCQTCDNYIYESGFCTCKILSNHVEGGDKDDI